MKKIFFILVIALILFIGLFFLLRPVFSGETVLSQGFSVLGFHINWYSLFIFLAALFGLFWVSSKVASLGLTKTQGENLVLLSVIAGLVGARVHHVLTGWEYYTLHRVEIFYIWHGGLGIYGGIAFGLVAAWLFARWKKVSFLALADIMAPAAVIGQALGRWGNFFNYEAYGVATNLPWKMFVPRAHRLDGLGSVEFFHPLFLYESLWDLLIFLFLWRIGDFPRKRKGTIFGLYLILYALGRFFFESLRADVTIVYGLKLNMLLSLISFCLGLWVIFRPADKNEISLKIVV